LRHFTASQFSVAALVLTAAAIDFRSRRIPNWLTIAGVCVGLLLHGWSGLGSSLAGMMLGFAAYSVLYCLRAMGAGDVKLMAAVGAIIGPEQWVAVFVATAIAGGVIACMMMVWKGVRQTLWNTAFIVNELMHFRPPCRRRSDLDVKDSRALSMPHGVAVAAGTAVCLLAARI